VTSFSVRVPGLIKRSLTMMQITQFLVGASYAALHSFISYTIPVRVPDISSPVASTASVASDAVSTLAASVTSTEFANFLKKLLFRAVGKEGLAENASADHTVPGIPSLNPTNTAQHTEYRTIPCIDTSGQTFAIWLNVLYLAPLTCLFVRFFVKSYIIPSRSKKRLMAAKVGKDAIKGVERKLYENGMANGKANGKANGGMNGHANGKMPVRY